MAGLPDTRPSVVAVVYRNEHAPREVLPLLWQGGEDPLDQASFFASRGIGHVLSVCEKPCAPTLTQGGSPAALTVELTVLHIPLDDAPSSDLLSRLPSAVAFIHEARLHGSGVYIHCQQGVSRSSTCTLGYLMAHLGLGLNRAWHYLLRRKEYACPNPGFERQLREFEAAVLPAWPRRVEGDETVRLRESDLEFVAQTLAERPDSSWVDGGERAGLQDLGYGGPRL